MGLEKQIEECGGGEKEDVIKKKDSKWGGKEGEQLEITSILLKY